jgi:hypothetical protein
MLLLYAIEAAFEDDLHNGHPQPRGLADEPLSTLTSGNLAALVSDVDTAPEATPQNFVAYERVIERLMGHATVLPARFGTTAETENEIKAMLVSRHDDFIDALRRVHGAVEFAVRVPAPGDLTEDELGSGTEYMQRLIDQSRQINELAAELERATEGLMIETRRTPKSVACLVTKHNSDAFLEKTRATGLTVTGPWPPYSFVNQ